jgi:hypothetical protein
MTVGAHEPRLIMVTVSSPPPDASATQTRRSPLCCQVIAVTGTAAALLARCWHETDCAALHRVPPPYPGHPC